jgi:hypothetical protein
VLQYPGQSHHGKLADWGWQWLTCSFHKFTVIGFRLTTLEKVKQDEFRLDMAAGRFSPPKNALLDFRWVDVNLRGRGQTMQRRHSHSNDFCCVLCCKLRRHSLNSLVDSILPFKNFMLSLFWSLVQDDSVKKVPLASPSLNIQCQTLRCQFHPRDTSTVAHYAGKVGAKCTIYCRARWFTSFALAKRPRAVLCSISVQF